MTRLPSRLRRASCFRCGQAINRGETGVVTLFNRRDQAVRFHAFCFAAILALFDLFPLEMPAARLD
jgi:hypothetical protein